MTSKTATAKKNTSDATAAKTEPPKDTDTAKALMTKHGGNKSACIRELCADGWKRGRIAKALDVRYQFVRNVEIRPLKRKAA